jgi:uncharacterized protein
LSSPEEVIPPVVRDEILRRIKLAEQEHGVRVLLAVESGSRAWGFASPNSDFDARFIYAHPKDWYLSVVLEDKRDVIEYPIVDDIDLNGWDIRKALRLFWKSNPAFIEWIHSPIIYLEAGAFASEARKLLSCVYSCEAGVHHYRSMAKTNYRSYLRGELVPLKKYFYVLRPLLSVQWIERYQTAPPIEFAKLLHLIKNSTLLQSVELLLAKKRAAPELGLSAPVLSINEFIEQELERLEGYAPVGNRSLDSQLLLDALFRESVA